MVVNFKENYPKYGTSNLGNKGIKTKNPDQIFLEEKKSNGSLVLDIICSCGNPECKNYITFFYDGLDIYGNSRNIGNDKAVNIHPCYKDKESKANNVIWVPTEENIAKLISFSQTAREAIEFKKELLKGLYAELQVRIKGYPEVELVVRKEEDVINFILFDIPHEFSKVPLISESTGYRECLGIIGTLPINTDTSKVKNEHADMQNPFFKPIINWVEILGKENDLSLEIHNIWVMPE